MSPDKEKIITEWQKDYWGADSFFSDDGFISYIISGDYIYIVNLFIEREFRHGGNGKELFSKFTNFVFDRFEKSKGILGDIQLNTPNATDKMKKFISYGGKIGHADKTKITMVYEFEGR